MKNINNPADNQEVVDRIMRLTAGTMPQWGKMNAGQMLRHCQEPLRIAFGETQLKRSILGILFGGMIKKKFSSPAPLRRSLPTDKTFIFADDRDFDKERNNLITAIRRFTDPTERIGVNTHPFFGKLTRDEWGVITWKHLDHHLTQFGV